MHARLVLIALAVTLATACQKAPGAATDDGDPPRATASAQMPKVHLTAQDGTDQVVSVEVVRTGAELERGLMYRRHLDPDRGMLFIMGETQVHTFWMKNTYIPLDMLFITQDKTVAGIVENAEPLTLDHRFVDTPSYYVLEVNGGWSAKHGVTGGAKVTFDGVTE
ncbi:MAG: DUF192 domain-containing protein [Kofleriaceae bacterium]|nr:DUF192 domain-containing protein [Myxococcales bacterium]MCB9560657.1 DUF192 domain-containing protein [Kofleriaceae bacterium]MCB9575173.1 DUF192 domain-containing protein [Kofleriaceae bacterium]